MKTLKLDNLVHSGAIRRWSAILMLAQAVVLPQLRAETSEKPTTPPKETTDSGITTAVEDGFIFEKGVFWSDVDVNTSKGIVTLSGSVDNLLAKDRAVKIAESIRGVRGVIDQTAVTPVSRPDEDIRKDILTALLQDPATDSYQVAVSVKDAVASLTGSVGSYLEKQLTARIAEGVKGTKKINNDINVNYLVKRTDPEIESDVKARLQWDIWLNSDMINATVQERKVTLTGIVGSAVAKSRASDDAWLNGVTGVDDTGLSVDPAAREVARRKLKFAERSDSEIMQAIVAAFRLDPRVSAFSPQVTVEGGVVVLGGNVGNLKAKTSAEQDARNTVGVWQIDNLLKVRPKSRPTDAEMEGQLKAALLWDPLLTNSAIDVAIINRIAYLSGKVDSTFQSAEAQDVATRIKGVFMVRNRLKVEPDFSIAYGDWPYSSYDGGGLYSGEGMPYFLEPSGFSETFGRPPNSTDEQIKTKVEHAFFWSPFVDTGDINVTVHGGVATLTGTVGSWMGWDEADKDARKSGASFVINRIEIKKGAWSWL